MSGVLSVRYKSTKPNRSDVEISSSRYNDNFKWDEGTAHTGALLICDRGDATYATGFVDSGSGVLACAGVGSKPAFRALALTDLPTITPAYGGTGLTSYAVGDLLYASGTTTIAKLADVATGSVLVSGGVGVAPSWSASLTLSGALTAGTITASGGLVVPGGQNITLTAASYVGTTTAALWNFGANNAASWQVTAVGDLTDLGSHYIRIGSYLAIGAAYATAGAMRTAHGFQLNGRDSGNSWNRSIIDWGVTTADRLYIGDGGIDYTIIAGARTRISSPTCHPMSDNTTALGTTGAAWSRVQTYQVVYAALTYATLPGATSGAVCYITDCTTNTFGATAAGGGSYSVLVWYNGSAWKVVGI